MRSLLLISVLGSLVASSNLVGQSLTEHAAAAAGATLGTAAGKPLGGALGKAFGEVDKSPSTVAPKYVKPVAAKPAPAGPAKDAEHPATAGAPAGGGGGGAASGGGGGGEAAAAGGGNSGKTARSRHASHRAELPIPPQAVAVPSAPITPEPVAAPPAIKEPSAQDVAGIRLGATSSELRQALGTAESTVSIPGDDGHLLEIRQYWANGEPVGTVRLDNGHVVSVRPNN